MRANQARERHAKRWRSELKKTALIPNVTCLSCVGYLWESLNLRHTHPHTIITISARKYFSLVAIASVRAESPPLLPRRQKRARNLRYRIGHRPRRSVSICTLSRNYPKKKFVLLVPNCTAIRLKPNLTFENHSKIRFC